MDPFSMLLGGGLVAVGWAVGQLTRRRASTSQVTAHSLCSCGHGYGTHTEGKQCGAEIERPRPRDLPGYDWVPCACKAYDGPEPLPRIGEGLWFPPPRLQKGDDE